ncbi:MAG: Gfo/Idh/MocA family oxidoreductase [Planctomycetes bacterium]|nr:Gfo/Idh/MocA family oxidoreductase [Planctomycetota bacterium]
MATARPRERLRVAVIGCGHLGKFHARIYKDNPRAELVGLVDTDSNRVGALAKELGVPAFSTAAELPRDVDAVSIAVPTIHHASVAVPLLSRGLACLVEKPIAATPDEGARMLAAAKQGDAVLAIGHVERFQPGLRKIAALGMKPRFIECHRLAPFSFRSMDIGVVHDLMIHDLDLILHLVPSAVESFDAAGGAILTEREDLASVRLVFQDGARANVTASRVSLAPMRRFRMFSSESYVSLDFTKNYGLMVKKGPRFDAGRAELKHLDPAVLAERPDRVKSDMIEVQELELGDSERPLQAELDSFLRCVQTGETPEVSGADGLAALTLAERISTAIRSQAW